MADRFYAFYQNVNTLTPHAAGRPQGNLVRLFSRFFRRPAASMPVRFDSFHRDLQKRLLAVDMYEFAGRYPGYSTIDQKDVWFLAPT
jgi:hypothetical protein